MSMESLQGLNITADTITAYDKRLPRYTSYPTAPFWTTDFGPDAWAAHLQESSPGDRPLSLYVHIPFCKKRCLFCGCNVIVTRKDWVADDYLDLLEKEVHLVRQHYKGNGRVIQLHLGGGTPNFLTHPQMTRLLGILEESFPFDFEAERSIEVDPRTATPEDVDLFHNQHAFNRISFGTQDFNEETQLAIGRGQTLDITFANVEAARKAGFRSVNLDLIYGLPKQTAASWEETLEAVCKLRPDRIALYNFAFLPSLLPHQRQLTVEDFPPTELKLEMFIGAYNRLTGAGWDFIGMDHYALENDSLTRAQKAGSLRRNFMGYTTLRGTDALAFGVSSISDYAGAFAQNVKKLSEYREMIEAGRLPTERGLRLSPDDLLRRHMIEEVMCNGILRFDLEEPFPGAVMRAIVDEELERLRPLMEDDLLTISADALRVTKKGRVFLRNIAVVFDAYLKKPLEKPLFSKAV